MCSTSPSSTVRPAAVGESQHTAIVGRCSRVPRCQGAAWAYRDRVPSTGEDLDAARRHQAAAKYRPQHVRLLLIAHAPPDDVDRYFYFEDVREKDDLFRYVVQGLFGVMPHDRSAKALWLARLRDAGVFLIDLVEQPISSHVRGRKAKVRDLKPFVPGLIDRARALRPEHVLLIKTDVYDAAFRQAHEAGLPVVAERMPFPTSGRQKEFERGFARAIGAIGWTEAAAGGAS